MLGAPPVRCATIIGLSQLCVSSPAFVVDTTLITTAHVRFDLALISGSRRRERSSRIDWFELIAGCDRWARIDQRRYGAAKRAMAGRT